MKILVSSKRYQYIKGAGMFFMFAIAQLTVTLTNGQQHLFSTNKYLFATEIESFFGESQGFHRQRLNDVASNMQRSLVAGHFSDFHVAEMAKVANRMMNLQLPAYPTFYYYFGNALEIIKFNQAESFFNDWNSGVLVLLQEPVRTNLDKFLLFSHQFFNQRTLYESNSVRWDIRNGSWKFQTDSIPLLIVTGADLICYAGADSSRIKNASGTYDPFSMKWTGITGQVTWERVSFSSHKVHALLGRYSIHMRSSGFEADTAWLHYPELLSVPIAGTLHEQASPGITPANSNYPKFTSFETSLNITNIFPGIDFTGGIALEGNRMTGFGAFRNDAVLLIHYQEKPVVRLASRNFNIRSDRITSQRAATTIYFCNDSIVHPGLEMRYSNSSNELTLLRSATGLPSSPFFSSYHGVDIYVEAIYWNTGRAEIELGGIRGLKRESEAVFESQYYFTPTRFYQLQGIDEYHPLVALNDYARLISSNTFYHEELATFMGINLSQVSAMLIHLTTNGFVLYNPGSGKVVVKERLSHYLEAFNHKKDHDVIRIVSRVNETVNAVLNIEHCNLSLRGVPEAVLSNTQRVNIYPAGGEIVLTRNLGIEFTGNIHAGFFDFYVGPSVFDYNSFSLLLPQVDSLSFVVPVETPGKPKELVRVKTVISNISGELLIGHPHNKSGRLNQPQYPAFRSKTDSYVYFNQTYVQNGVYGKDRFYYHVLPFEIDSLHSFTTVGMSFNGYLFSGGIIPEISEPLRVQPDFSLGFQTSSPLNNAPVYNGAASFTGSLALSHKGLIGAGIISYLNATMEGDSLLFHPDSLMANRCNFHLAEIPGSLEFPVVQAENAAIVWHPGEGLAILTNHPSYFFMLFNHQIQLSGTLEFGPKGLFGAGTARWQQAVWQSGRYSFTRNSLSAEWCDFSLEHPSHGIIFMSTGYDFDFELLSRQGQFNRNGDNAVVSFPFNKYSTRADAFRWEADYDEIHLNNEYTAERLSISTLNSSRLSPSDFGKSVLLSLCPDQDSLGFFAITAQYDMRNLELNAFEVPSVQIANTAVIPVDGRVTISNNGTIRPLKGAMLYISPENLIHTFYNVDIEIYNRNSFSASGYLMFNGGEGYESEIHFSEIKADSLGIAFANAQIHGAGMFINPYFRFKGSVHIGSAARYLFLNGYYKPTQYFKGFNPKWVRFASALQSNNIVFPATFPMKGEAGETIYATLHYNLTSGKLYPAFFAPKTFSGDTALIVADGFVGYDTVGKFYYISNTPYEHGGSNRNIVRFNTQESKISGNGKINFGHEFGRVSMLPAGSIKHFATVDSTILELFAAFDFFFSREAFDLIIKQFENATLQNVSFKPTVEAGIHALFKPDEAERLISELGTRGSLRRLPDNLSRALIFNDLTMTWNHRTKSFTSTGPLGVMVINGQHVNKYVEGRVEIIRRTEGDAFNIYFEQAPNQWFFFHYSAGVLHAVSSLDEFNSAIAKMSEERRMLPARKQEVPYRFVAGTTHMRDAFVQRMR